MLDYDLQMAVALSISELENNAAVTAAAASQLYYDGPDDDANAIAATLAQ